VLELFETLDSKKAKELGEKLTPADMLKQLGGAAAAGGGQQLSAEKIQELIEEMKKRQPAAPAPGPVAPGPVQDAPAPAPSGAP
jgi:hypothetical protein